MPATDEAVELAVTAADAADDRKATDLSILEVADILAVVDLFLLATTSSDRQLRAVVERIEERLRETHDRRPLRREGEASSGWMLLDFGDLVCHVFLDEQRDYYALDRLWSDVPRRDVRTGERLAAPTPAGDAGVGTPPGQPPLGDDEVADLAADLDALDRDLDVDLEAELDAYDELDDDLDDDEPDAGDDDRGGAEAAGDR